MSNRKQTTLRNTTALTVCSRPFSEVVRHAPRTCVRRIPANAVRSNTRGEHGGY
jgi:hypothetical protein